MKWSWRIARLAGIDLYIHATFPVLLVWVASAHLIEGAPMLDAVLASLFLAALFGIVVLHELGHAFAARRYGIRTLDITLLPIGGLARLERMPEEPRHELLIALAGPAVNLMLAGASLLMLVASGVPVTLPDYTLASGPLLVRLLWANVELALFNLIPAFPMDGGRVLRALIALEVDHVRATQIAVGIGRALALGFCFLGLLGNPLLVFIGLFVWISAEQEALTGRCPKASPSAG